ncbi:virginiamycin B lyase family protein [Compostimonas suwonensis]|uniref:Virginiamycin B lyase n=1 Tax=Compostimonas suwonensis TaxID=1048394 RepID=A0A2M9BBG0_9MICO|nr:virginiamycin B lyase [Compostimonas suwonensis]PJJ55274.1 virginiamycin B lyase [Compostimonas suwonensis]
MGRIVEHIIADADAGPYAVAVTADGAVWCSLVSGAALVRLAPDGGIRRIPLGEGSRPSLLAAGASDSVWVTDTTGNRIVLVGESGVLTSIAVPTEGAQPYGIVSLDDGTVWFTELASDALGRIDVLGRVTEFSAGTRDGVVSMIAAAGESLWFTANRANAIGMIRGGDSAVRLFEIPTPDAGPVGITVGGDGAAWFVEILAGQIGRVDRNGGFTEFPLPDRASKPHAICADPAGGCWFTLWGSNQLGHIAADGEIALIELPAAHGEPHGLAVAPDGTVWVALETGALLAVTP